MRALAWCMLLAPRLFRGNLVRRWRRAMPPRWRSPLHGCLRKAVLLCLRKALPFDLGIGKSCSIITPLLGGATLSTPRRGCPGGAAGRLRMVAALARPKDRPHAPLRGNLLRRVLVMCLARAS